jgi:hypothetical protein
VTRISAGWRLPEVEVPAAAAGQHSQRGRAGEAVECLLDCAAGLRNVGGEHFITLIDGVM